MNTDTKERTMNSTDLWTASAISSALNNGGVPTLWDNTGGGVMNLIIDVTDANGMVIGHVQISDHGDWGRDDLYTPIDGTVTVIGYDIDGDSVMDERLPETDCYALTITDVFTLVRDMAEAVRETWANNEQPCSECDTLHRVADMVDITRAGVDPCFILYCKECNAQYAPLSPEVLAAATPVAGKVGIVEIDGWRYCATCGLSVVACNGEDR